jgi:hypothetical protein
MFILQVSSYSWMLSIFEFVDLKLKNNCRKQMLRRYVVLLALVIIYFQVKKCKVTIAKIEPCSVKFMRTKNILITNWKLRLPRASALWMCATQFITNTQFRGNKVN